MKRIIFMVAILLLAIPAMAQYEEKFPSYIQVNGRAEQEITPDEFYLSIVINERESKGKITVEQQQKEMIAALGRLGVNIEQQLKMANMSSEFLKKKTSVATAKYQLKLHSAAMVSKVYSALDDIGISNVAILRVSHSQLNEYKDRIRIAAMQDAKNNARTLAEAVGQKIGPCFYIYDSNNDIMPIFYNNLAVARGKMAMDSYAEADSDEAPLDFKTIKLTYNVQAKFVLEQ